MTVDADQQDLSWESPSISLIKAHYAQYRFEFWDNARVSRLARMLKCTVPEVCAMVGLFGPRAKSLWKKGAAGEPWPPELVLQFTRLEQFASEILFKTVSPLAPQDAVVGRQIARAEKLERN